MDMDDLIAAWNALPQGHFDGLYQGRRYGVTRSMREGGRQGWIWAEELGSNDRISSNLYFLKSGLQLKPCEMPAQKVIDFILGVRAIDE